MRRLVIVWPHGGSEGIQFKLLPKASCGSCRLASFIAQISRSQVGHIEDGLYMAGRSMPSVASMMEGGNWHSQCLNDDSRYESAEQHLSWR